MEDLKAKYLRQLNTVISFYNDSSFKSRAEEDSARILEETTRFNALAIAAIERIVGPDSIYGQMAHVELKNRDSYSHFRLIGLVHALHDDVASGFLTSFKEIVHGEVFSDFLDMADYFAERGYKDAAAIMGGGVLESHLRQLCIKHEIDITTEDRNHKQIPKRVNQLNEDLARKQVYNLLDKNNVTTWYTLRNTAAHAGYEKYTPDQVTLMLQGIRDFMARYPA